MHQHSHLARVRSVTEERATALLEEYLKRNGSMNGAESGLYFWDAEISNTLLDSHFTHMSEKTLRNYAEDAERGVAFLRGHDWQSLPAGYSVSGLYSESEGRKRVMAGFYTVRGLPDTNDLIARMESKLLRDVSVGFHGGRTVCDICSQDFWDCRHFPGLTYEEKKGDVVTKTLATFEIDDARLSEVSGVFDGSTPQAMIRKAEVVARAGELSPEQVQLIESRYRIALPSSKRFAVPELPSQGEHAPKENGKMNEQEVIKARSILGIGEEGNLVSAIEEMNREFKEAQKRIATLEPQAKEGEQYRSDLVADALAEGIRAQGSDFDKDLYESTLKSAPLAVVKRMRDDWRKVADKTLPGGRKTQDTEDRGGSNEVSLYPDAAYS